MIRKAVFPVAGLGTRFLPATKATPKEMLPIVDKPLIQYAVEEAIEAGITQLIFVTSSTKRAIEDHFDSNFELETTLRQKEKYDLLEIVENILPRGVSCIYIRQDKPLGLGHAVLCAKPAVGGEPFAVLLADDLISGKTKSCLNQMAELYSKLKSSVIAVEPISPEETRKYGVVAFDAMGENTALMTGIVEKPEPTQAPSNLAVVGRYILAPEIFNYLETIPQGAGGEIQLTDAIAQLLKEQDAYAYQFHGKRYDCGSKLGYLEATLEYAMRHPELAEPFKNVIKEFARAL